jgi:hypothetical protein
LLQKLTKSNKKELSILWVEQRGKSSFWVKETTKHHLRRENTPYLKVLSQNDI